MPRPAAPFDVVVVGAGLFGAWLTHRLAARGATVALVESDDVGAHASRARLVLDVGLLGVPDPERARRERRALAILRAQAPHLVSELPIRTRITSGWARARALASLALHDTIDLGPRASATREGNDAIVSTGHAIEEARLTLALVLRAQALGAVVSVGAVVRSFGPRDGSLRVELEGASPLQTRTVVITAGGDAEAEPAPDATQERSLEALFSARASDVAFVDDRDGRRLEHVPLGERSLVRVSSEKPVDRATLLAHLEACLGPLPEALEIHDERRLARHEAPARVTSPGLPEVIFATGAELGSMHEAIEALAQRLAPGPAGVGDDARLEDADVEVTPAIERTRLGAEVLGALVARHGERAGAIAERVMIAPREGAIVCPCSTVTEAELRHACQHELARDLRALSRRCELGVGPCQGARCARRAAAILSEAISSESASFEGDAAAAEDFLQWRARRSALAPERAAMRSELAHGLDVAAGRAGRSDG